MNLHGIVRAAISSINPDISVLWRQSNGYTQDASYKQVPAYIDYPVTVVQLQALSSKDLQHPDLLNVQGVMRALYMNGSAEGVNRAFAKGGDLFTISGQVWKVVTVLETWPDWCKVAINLQGAT